MAKTQDAMWYQRSFSLLQVSCCIHMAKATLVLGPTSEKERKKNPTKPPPPKLLTRGPIAYGTIANAALLITSL